eukprot:TRINITY_DN3176_c0_g1_i1.p1 TRINITY_DN3176_c0_g1~~TRINITY_DN3176_c0_g1_i1.p1  ORF type:complete len:298 (+),score=104.26 TRINITY_DN3176_c0_g1_i1:50-943(+)
MGKSAQQQAKGGQPVREPVSAKTAPKLIDIPQTASEEPVLPIFRRGTDVVLSGLYCALGFSSLFALVVGCKGQGPKMHPLLEPACDFVKDVSLTTPMELRALWYKDVYAASTAGTDFLHFAYCLNNVVFALPLSLIMLAGAKGNSFQKPAIMHGSILLLLNAFYYTVGAAASPANQHVFDTAYITMLVVPLLFLHRWWGENVFTASHLRCSGFLCAFIHFLVNIALLTGLAYTMIIMYEWAIDTHKDFKGYQRVSPHIEVYTKVAQQHVQEASAKLGASLQDVGKILIDKVNSLTQK